MNFYPCVDTYWCPCTDTNNNKIQIHMSNKSKQGNIIGSGPQRDGAFGGRKTIMRKDPWFPGKSRGCNYASKFGGIRKGDKVAFGRRLRRKVA